MTVGQGGEAFDYVIVGAGSAGCVIANRLSEDAGTRICLVEAGPQTRHPFVSIPLGMVGLIDHPRLNWRYMSAPQQAAGGRRYPIPRGKMLGGTSSLNGMVYTRGQAADFDGWAALGNPGWSYREVLPYFMKSEDYVDGPSEAHGTGGEWRVENQRLHWDVLDHWRDAAVAAGLPATSAQGDAALLQQVQQVLCSLAFAPAGDAESGLTHCPLCAQAAALALPATATGPIQPVIRACWPAGEPALGGSGQRARPQSARGPPFRA